MLGINQCVETFLRLIFMIDYLHFTCKILGFHFQQVLFSSDILVLGHTNVG